MGHSCGLSDRTMLKEIFEHDNCKSIKTIIIKWGNESYENDYDEKPMKFQDILMIKE